MEMQRPVKACYLGSNPSLGDLIMNREAAIEIVNYITHEGKRSCDYGRSYTMYQIVNAFACLNIGPPRWVSDYLIPRVGWNLVEENACG